MAGAATKALKSKKTGRIKDLKDITANASVAVVADYRGLTVAELSDLRAQLFKQNASFTVTKNTLMRKAIEGTEHDVLKAYLKGPTAILFGTSDQVGPVKTLKEFLKKSKKDNEIFGGYMDGQLLSPSQVQELADLPSLDELRGKLAGCLVSPLRGLVGAVSSQQRGLVNVLDQYAKTKQAG